MCGVYVIQRKKKKVLHYKREEKLKRLKKMFPYIISFLRVRSRFLSIHFRFVLYIFSSLFILNAFNSV